MKCERWRRAIAAATLFMTLQAFDYLSAARATSARGQATGTVSLLPFNLERTGTNQYLVANMVGDFIRLTEDELNRLVDLEIRPGDGLYERAYAAHLVTGTNQSAQRQLLALRLRSRMSFLRHLTPLHIFVVTLRCEHSCPYCQVSRQSTDRSRFDMSEQTATRALDIAFASPSARIKIEFQGGEPLLNFPLIKNIVSAAKARSNAVGKKSILSSRRIWRCWTTLF
jgi:sulfatase maturation enzyme AslB (radical SAM superfamily)